MIDLDAYFARIGYAGPRAADLAVLRRLHALHPAAIAFENLDPLLGRPVSLDLGTLQRKLVGGRRGGYCFEQNTLFRAALEALGFTVAALAGRTLWMLPPDAPPGPRTHMLLRVDLADGPYLADVGYGGHLLAAPLRLVADLEQATPAGMLRLRPGDGFLVLQTRLGADWRDVYRFTLEAQAPIDQEVGNWFTSAHPNSRFRRTLMMERLTPEVRVSLTNKRLTRRRPDGSAERRTIACADELERVLAVDFAVDPPVAPALWFDRLPD